MTASSLLPAPNLMPLMRYRDLAEAMGWLERAFDFEKQIAVTDSDGAVIYGQMTYRGGLLMMGAIRDTELDKLMRQPDEVGGAETQSCYIVVEDADAHYAKAREAGAEILLDIKSDGLGRRGYSCRDPQGHIWNFGTYSPGKGLTMTPPPAVPAETPVAAAAPARRPMRLMAIAALLAGLGAGGWWFGADIKSDLTRRVAEMSDQRAAAEASRAYAELVKVRAEKREADAAAAGLRKELDAERARRKDLEASQAHGGSALAEAQQARLAAESAVASLRTELQRAQEALEDAREARRVSEEKLAAAQAAAAAAPPASPAVTAAPPGGNESKIETSATQPLPLPERKPSEEDDTKSRDRPAAKARAARSKRPSTMGAGPRSLPPTYMVDLQSVPWPYNTWYK